MRVMDAMSKRVISISPTASVAEALDLMLREHISGMPVVDRKGALVGVISEGDFLRRFELGTAERSASWLKGIMFSGSVAKNYARTHARRVDEIMSSDVLTVGPNEDLGDAAALMESRRIKRLPVVGEDGRTVGILTRADFIRALLAVIRPSHVDVTIDDAEIEQRIDSELHAQSWTPMATIDFAVKNGVVTFTGMVTDERHRAGIRALAENIPGVREVHDRMYWADPLSAVIVTAPEDEAGSDVA